MNLSDTEYQKIEAFALEYYAGLDYLHATDHAERTVKIAEYLAKQEGADVKLVRLGALLHQFHDHEEILIDFLQSLGLDQPTIDVLVGFPLFRPYKNVEPNSIEEQVVFDADAIQNMGVFGIIRSIVNYAPKHKDLAFATDKALDVQQKFFNILQTESAKQLISQSQQRAKDFLEVFDKEFNGKYW